MSTFRPQFFIPNQTLLKARVVPEHLPRQLAPEHRVVAAPPVVGPLPAVFLEPAPEIGERREEHVVPEPAGLRSGVAFCRKLDFVVENFH